MALMGGQRGVTLTSGSGRPNLRWVGDHDPLKPNDSDLFSQSISVASQIAEDVIITKDRKKIKSAIDYHESTNAQKPSCH